MEYEIYRYCTTMGLIVLVLILVYHFIPDTKL